LIMEKKGNWILKNLIERKAVKHTSERKEGFKTTLVENLLWLGNSEWSLGRNSWKMCFWTFWRAFDVKLYGFRVFLKDVSMLKNVQSRN
jgi:hypothetical protein